MAKTGTGPIKELTLEDGCKLLDKQARRYLNLSGSELIKKWEAGDFGDDPDQPEIMRLVMLIPFAK